MLKRKFIGERVITSALVLLLLPGTSLRIAGAEQWDAPPRGIAVYVRDFAFSVALAAAPAYTDTPPEALQLRSRQVQNFHATPSKKQLYRTRFAVH